MPKPFSLSDLKNSACANLNAHLWVEKDTVKEKRSKYRNEIVEFDGYVFRSKKELGRYVSLRAKQNIGEISDLQLQVPFELNDGGTHSYKYVADFLYKEIETGEFIIDDTKGKETVLFKKKAKLMLRLFGIKVRKS